jgi:hypothetical protein
MNIEFQIVSAWVGLVGGINGVVGGSLGIIAIISQIRDRSPHPKLTISLREEIIKNAQKDKIGQLYPAKVPAISARLVNRGIIRLYPEAATVFVENHLIAKLERNDLKEDRPFCSLLDHGQVLPFAYSGQELCDLLPAELRSKPKLKVWVIIAFESGKTCQSNKLAVIQTSLQSNLPVLEFGF